MAAGGTADTVWIVGMGAALVIIGGVLGAAGFDCAIFTREGLAGDSGSSGSSSFGVRGPRGVIPRSSSRSSSTSSGDWVAHGERGGVIGGVLGEERGRGDWIGDAGLGMGGVDGRLGSMTRITPSLLLLLLGSSWSLW